MKVLRGDPVSWDAGGPHVVTIGVFDGVHRGHQHIVSLTREHAARLGIRSGLVTFDRHPLTVLAPQHAPPLLTSLEQRLELFEAAGLDTVGILPFGPAVRDLSPEDFVTGVIVMGFGARMIVVGEDFRFGKDRAGNVEVLGTVGDEFGFGVEAVSLLGNDGLLSSSRIRAMVAEGDVDAVAEALARPFEVRGRVVGAVGEGSRAGFPTLRVAVEPGLAVPGRGVYAVWAAIEGGDALPAVACLDGDASRAIEVRFLDEPIDPVEAGIRLLFVARIRGGRVSDDPADLSSTLTADVEEARRRLTRAP